MNQFWNIDSKLMSTKDSFQLVEKEELTVIRKSQGKYILSMYISGVEGEENLLKKLHILQENSEALINVSGVSGYDSRFTFLIFFLLFLTFLFLGIKFHIW